MSLNRIPLVSGMFFALFLLQEGFLNRINFFIGGFSLYLAFFIAWIIHEDRSAALIVGFIAGFIADLSPTLEAPFGLWTFTLTAIGYLVSVNLQGSVDAIDSPLTTTLFTVLGSTIALIFFLICGAILGNDFGSFSSIIKTLVGNSIWTFVLSPIYVPATSALRKASLTARDR